MDFEDYRVWPDGMTQLASEESAPTWMSDDFMMVRAASHEDALLKAGLVGAA